MPTPRHAARWSMTARNFSALSIPDIDPSFSKEKWRAVWENLKSGSSKTLVSQHRTKHGRVFPVEVTACYLEFGGKEYSFAFARDITDRIQAEEALRQSEAKLKEALLAAQMGVWEWTRPTDAVTWDENLFRIAGRDPKLPAPSFREHSQIFAPESWERLKAAVENALAAGTPYEFDLELVRPDGYKEMGHRHEGNRCAMRVATSSACAARCRTSPSANSRRKRSPWPS